MLCVLLSSIEGYLAVAEITRLQVEEHHKAVAGARLRLHLPPVHQVDCVLQRLLRGGVAHLQVHDRGRAGPLDLGGSRLQHGHLAGG